jgi:Uma2 family endonuclease
MTTRSRTHAKPPTLPRRRFTVDEYECMGRAGILHEDERVELIEGEILEMPPIGSSHGGHVYRVQRWFERRLGDQAFVFVQNAVRLSGSSQPQPDIAILKPHDDLYIPSLPEPADILLVIEIADSSLAYDRDVKMPMYARADIAEAWLVAVQPKQLMVHRRPRNGRFQDISLHELGADVTPLAFPDLVVLVSDLLG